MGRYRKAGLTGRFSGGLGDKTEDLRYIIRVLDNIRAMRRTDPFKLAEKMELYGFKDLYDQIKPGIEEIVYLPNRLPGIKTLLQVTGVLRSLFPVSLIAIILSVLMRTGLFPMVNPVIYRLFLVVPVVILIGFVLMDFTLRRMITRYEKQHPDLHKNEKKLLREAAAKIIPRLQRELRETGTPPESCPLPLYFDDYPGITIIKTKKERSLWLFKKPYDTYVGIVSFKKKPLHN